MDQPDSNEPVEAATAQQQEKAPKARSRGRRQSAVGTTVATPLVRTTDGDLSAYISDLERHRTIALAARR